ncbi:hypothetical protein LTR72_007281 [Exophiala xenobiotica]|nr:hypothetical protein LTR41_006678 [Exophiala xenobiotica]KAK5220659.1 hypothetical protein LTR72_007281 [Exophiala xenobiotica]KAK5413619.1 hypothetical protein LTR06_005046 [Exophiala xenobiotica]KAK5561147.1 hypothetical protein LTR46_001457 [Exophiala xenobiotica]
MLEKKSRFWPYVKGETGYLEVEASYEPAGQIIKVNASITASGGEPGVFSRQCAIAWNDLRSCVGDLGVEDERVF